MKNTVLGEERECKQNPPISCTGVRRQLPSPAQQPYFLPNPFQGASPPFAVEHEIKANSSIQSSKLYSGNLSSKMAKLNLP